jgi:excisionase family DNA binding protein
MTELLSIKIVAARLSCSESMLKKWIAKGRIPTVKVGRLTRIRQEDVEAWVRLGLRKDTSLKEDMTHDRKTA